MKFFLFHSVGKNPGLKALTLPPLFPHSRARFWVRFLIPDLDTEYAKALDKGGFAEAEEMLIIEPFLLESICFPKTWQAKKVPVS